MNNMQSKLDLKDKKLLFEMDFDSRRTYAELARKLRMSKRGVEYKINNLEKKGIISGYSPIINLQRLGYSYFRIFIKFQNLTKKIKSDIESYVRNRKKVGWFIWYHGFYDAGFTIWAKTVTEFKEEANEFYFKFHKNILNRLESISSEVNFYKSRYLLGNSSEDKIRIEEKSKEIEIDELDKKILRLLVHDPRLSLVNLSEKLKEQPKRISYRIKRLCKEKVLLAIRPVVNHEIIGKIYYKVFIYLTNVSKEETRNLEENLEKDPRVIYNVKALGTGDLDIELMVDSNQEFFDFIEKLEDKLPGAIKDYQSMILSKTVKSEFLPF